MNTLAVSTAWRRRLAGIVVGGAAIRIAVLAARWNDDLKVNDSLWYSIMASDLVDGRWFRVPFGDGPTAEHAPLISIVMAPLSLLPNPVVGQRITTTLLGIAAIIAIAVTARRLAGERAGLVAGLLAAAYPNIWLSDGLVMSESLAILLVAVVLGLAHSLLQSPDTRSAVAVGAVSGLAALTRSELLLLGPLLAVVVLLRHRWRVAVRPLAAAAAAGLVVLAPWTAFNATRFERPVLLTNNDGTTLLGANCDEVYGGPNLGGWSLFCVLDGPEPPGDESVRAAARRDEGLRHLRDNIDRVPVVVAARLLRVVDLYGAADMVNGDVGEERPRAAVWAGIAMMWVLIPSAAAGIWRAPTAARHLLVVPIAIVLLTTVLFYGGHRLRAPAEPALCIAAALAIARWLPDRLGRHPRHPLQPVGGEAAVGGTDQHGAIGPAWRRAAGAD